jgi:two-component system chemotaxis response regulator CheB
MPDHKVIVIGSSAGGVLALKELVAALPADFKTPLFIVQHVAPNQPSYLAEILNHAGPLRAVHPRDGTKIDEGMIYVAPPDHHLLIEGDHLLVRKGPKENRFRPSIDALFRSAAYCYGSNVIGVVLTGMLDDGCSGMWSLKRMGGVAIVQDPVEALYPSMPQSVLEYVEPDHLCSLSEISQLLIALDQKARSQKPSGGENEIRLLKMEVDIAALSNAFDKGIVKMGEHTPLTCPECGGALNGFTEGKLVRYRCHTGHAFSSASLLADVTESAEQKLWSALRCLEEAFLIVEKEASVYAEPAVGYSARLQALKSQAEELHRFLEHYLQFNDSSQNLGDSVGP